MTDLASISPLVVVGARRVNGGGCGRVGQDVNEVWIHHVVVKQVKDAHSIRSICREKNTSAELSVRMSRVGIALNKLYVSSQLRDIPGFMGLKLMSMGSVVLVLTCTMAEVGNTRMCVQDVS